jgi:hypothetical protein
MQISFTFLHILGNGSLVKVERLFALPPDHVVGE